MFDAAAFVLPAPARAGPVAGQAAENGILMNDLGDALPVYSSPGMEVPGISHSVADYTHIFESRVYLYGLLGNSGLMACHLQC